MNSLRATLRDQRRQNAIDAIARVALDLIRERGYNETSVEDIATALDFTPRTFYRYFASKEDVLFHDVPAMLERLPEMLETYLAEGLAHWEAVTETMIGLLGLFDAENEEVVRDRIRLWLTEPALQARFMQIILEGERSVTEVLQAAPGASRQDRALAPVRAITALHAYRATQLAVHDAADGRSLAVKLRETLAAIGEGLARP